MFFIIIVFNNNNNKNIKIAPVRRRNYFLISFRVTETTHVRSSPDKNYDYYKPRSITVDF